MSCLVKWVLIFISLNGAAQAGAVTLDAEGEAFKGRLLRAYATQSQEEVTALLHPKSAACLRTEPTYQRYLMRAETIQPIPESGKVSVNAISANDPLPYKGFEFPVRPSHEVRIEFGRQVQADQRSAITQIASKHIARDAGKWHLILPCPTKEGMGRLREMGLLNP